MRVLVATDGSADARAAVAWLETFPLPSRARVMALTVERMPYLMPDVLAAPRFDEMMRQAAARTADEAREALAWRFPDVEARVAVGDPREAIVHVADEWAADLIVVGARGLDTAQAFMFGSVSAAVVRWAPCPVLVVKGRRIAVRQVVIGVDGSAHAAAATRFFASLPLDPRTSVRLVSAVDPPLVRCSTANMPVPEVRAMLDELERRHAETATAALAGLQAELVGRVESVERSIVFGRPADVLVDASADAEVGLVVVGARGLGPLKRLVLGSVSEHVLQRAECPVLVVTGVGRTSG